MTRIAYLTERRDLFVIEPDGRHVDQNPTVDAALLWGAWAKSAESPSTFSWPTWSADGKTIAAFRVTGERVHAFVHVVSVGRSESSDLADINPRLPIYVRHSPSGATVATLSQEQERLVLSVSRLDRVGGETRLAEGSPLFFCWNGEARLTAYIGTAWKQSRAPTARMVEIDTSDGAETVYPGEALHFCAPLSIAGQGIYVALSATHGPAIVKARAGDSELTAIAAVEGLPALVLARDGKTIAYAEAPDGDGTPYQRLSLVDPDGGKPHRVHDGPFLAFLECAEGWLFARVDTARSVVRWDRVGTDGSQKLLCEHRPTRDMGFYLRFFEQFTPSHPIVDPTGEWLLLCGQIEGREGGKTPIWRVNTRTGDAEPVAEGVFATWGPAKSN